MNIQRLLKSGSRNRLCPSTKRAKAHARIPVRSFCVLALIIATGGLTSFVAAQTTSTIVGTVVDRQGLTIAEAEVRIAGTSIVANRSVTSNANGAYQIGGIPAGNYTLTVSRPGFSTVVLKGVEVTLNRTLTLNVTLEVGAVEESVTVSAQVPLLETNSSSQSTTIPQRDIVNMPINGRNYLDLLQMVPGVTINRQADTGSDNAVPVLGERGNNTGFLIDGLPNQNELNGGAAAQFNQDTIAEFQVITTGYKAEFGHASGGVVNVITKSGSNDTHGVASVFHRNSVLDSSDIPNTSTPFLLRWDYDLAAGGPIVKDKVFWFGSVERIHERRQLNFITPPNIPQVILDQENSYDSPTTDRETRAFGKFDEILGRHRLSEEVNYTNAHVGNFLPLSLSTNLPSTRQNLGSRSLLLGFSDTATLGDVANPYLLNLRAEYRREPSSVSPAHPQAGPYTIFNIFSGYDTGAIFGDLGQVSFGSLTTRSTLDQAYGTLGASIAKSFGKHTVKFGWDFAHTNVDGVEANIQANQLFATLADYAQFGPLNSGIYLLNTTGGATPQDNLIRLRNNYDGLFVQDDWKVARTLTLNLGVRWDYDSRFASPHDISPRLGFAWAATPKTVVRGSWGIFYDHFRLGIGRDIPGFGGANLQSIQPFSDPRLFYGIPTIAPALFGLCLSPTQTDAQLAGQTCPYPFSPPGSPIYGVDHLNNVVAPGHAPIPANSVVNIGNIQGLSGFTPAQYADAASQSIGKTPGFFSWGAFGNLSYLINPAGSYPVTVDPSFATPYSSSFTFGVQQQVSEDAVIAIDVYHKDIENLLGVRQTNLTFSSRINNDFVGSFVNGFGPWYSGTYNAAVFSFEKRMSRRFTLGGSYTYASESDDAGCSNFGTDPTGICYPTDSFRGIPPVVTDPGNISSGGTCAGGTNANGAFFACNGNYVPKAGVFYNGAKLDTGKSDLSLQHTFQVHGLLQLPWKFELSGLFRVQSGFPYTQSAAAPLDQDGNGNFNARDLKTARNGFTAPHFLNMDMRLTKTFPIGERMRIQGLVEFFNVFNSANPAAIQNQQSVTTPQFGAVSQFLPGREGQVGLRVEF